MMPTYKRSGASHPPYELDDNQDNWVVQISCRSEFGDEDGTEHEDCIEVRAETEILLNYRVGKIIEALNEALQPKPKLPPTELYQCEPCRDLEEVRKKMPTPPNNWACFLYGGNSDEQWMAVSKDGKWEQLLFASVSIATAATLQTIDAKLDRLLEK